MFRFSRKILLLGVFGITGIFVASLGFFMDRYLIERAQRIQLTQDTDDVSGADVQISYMPPDDLLDHAQVDEFVNSRDTLAAQDLFAVMGEGVISYERAGDYAANGNYRVAREHLTDAVLVFDTVSELIRTRTFNPVDEEVVALVGKANDLYKDAAQAAIDIVDGRTPTIHIGSTEAQARTFVQEIESFFEVQ